MLTAGLSGAALLLGIVALVLLGRTSQDSESFGRLNDLLLLLNVACALALLLLIAGNLWRLVRDYRARRPGAALRARMVGAFVALAVMPLAIVWWFAVQFLQSGIDNWFDLRVEHGLSDALELSRDALDLRLRSDLEKTREMARALSGVAPPVMVAMLGEFRRQAGASEVTIYGSASRIVATSVRDPATQLPMVIPDDVLLRLRQSGYYVGLDPAPDGRYQVRAAVLMPRLRPGAQLLALHAIYPLNERIGLLAESVERSYSRYEELAFLREPLRYSFIFTLSLVVLLSFLAALYGAFFFARRLVAPLQSLAAGTRAVAAGDLETRLPGASHDDVGFLIDSFNDMIERLAEAREAARSSAQQVERERAQLAVLLARLSTGVIVVNADGSIRIANDAAGAILGCDLREHQGESLPALARGEPRLAQFVVAVQAADAAAQGQPEWREQLVLRTDSGRRVLVCASTGLPAEEGAPPGRLLVFDDITTLLQAQRDAAWGEVARRLAHEIKNPLTPIQLAAERIRRRYLGSMQDMEAEILDRATHTIVQQVEAMRDMVNAFSEYARAPELTLSQVDLNQLVREVAFLYQTRDARSLLQLELDPSLEPLPADAVRLRQLLHNLIRNALEALDGRPEPELVIRTRRLDEEQAAELLVEDNGPGFDEATLDHAFEPYVTTKSKGTGLGLAIVKRLIEEHGGTVAAENRPSGGARVRVRLPLRSTQRDDGIRHAGRQQELRRERA
ncbi:MAG: HAMP domain-containing protein [Gammaproteobacteria bacterium]|nr:MAG: HAMP domain-containing protein [Gammaproteobacteria bacterium]